MKTKSDSASLHQQLKYFFGFNTFIDNQEAVIRNVLDGQHTFVLMPTGGGKSLCYQLPALMMGGTAIVVSPLIALMKNQVDNMRSFVLEEGVAHFLNSSLTKSAIAQVKEDVINGKTKMLYVAPESLTKEENIEFLKNIKISFYAIDEAHCISEWGHDFRPEYRRIRTIVDDLGGAPIIALTATATPKVQHDIQKNLGMLDAKVFKSSFNRANLYYEIRPKKDAQKELVKYVRQHKGKSGIVYCLSRKKVEELAQILNLNGIKALPYHAGMESTVRSGNQDKFLMEEVDVIVATIAFGMGIDKPDVRFVVHYDVPKSLEGYYQETGRAGRDHGEGHCLTFFSHKDVQKLEKFMQGKPPAEQEINKQLLMETVAYAESAVCRRKLLLHYFGEEYDKENCKSCDNCTNPKVLFEGKEYILTVLETIEATQDHYKSDYIIDVICGRATALIRSYKHDELEQFGEGKGKDSHFWSAVIRQALINDFITKEIEHYGILQLTDKGRAFLKQPYSVMLAEDHDYSDVDTGDDSSQATTRSQSAASAGDEQLYSMLKQLVLKVSQDTGVKPYVIFPETSLLDMSIHYPVSLEELQNCQGVGVGKAQKFGKPFVELIQQYVRENGIERLEDAVVKTAVNRSANKVFIIQSIDRKMDLEDIANAKNMEFLDLLTEIETIVGSGTKVDIDYYLKMNVDDDRRQDIEEYFREEAETDSIEEAVSALSDGDYTEEEIRLVRIQFLSEHAH